MMMVMKEAAVCQEHNKLIQFTSNSDWNLVALLITVTLGDGRSAGNINVFSNDFCEKRHFTRYRSCFREWRRRPSITAAEVAAAEAAARSERSVWSTPRCRRRLDRRQGRPTCRRTTRACWRPVTTSTRASRARRTASSVVFRRWTRRAGACCVSPREDSATLSQSAPSSRRWPPCSSIKLSSTTSFSYCRRVMCVVFVYGTVGKQWREIDTSSCHHDNNMRIYITHEGQACLNRRRIMI